MNWIFKCRCGHDINASDSDDESGEPPPHNIQSNSDNTNRYHKQNNNIIKHHNRNMGNDISPTQGSTASGSINKHKLKNQSNNQSSNQPTIKSSTTIKKHPSNNNLTRRSRHVKPKNIEPIQHQQNSISQEHVYDGLQHILSRSENSRYSMYNNVNEDMNTNNPPYNNFNKNTNPHHTRIDHTSLSHATYRPDDVHHLNTQPSYIPNSPYFNNSSNVNISPTDHSYFPNNVPTHQSYPPNYVPIHQSYPPHNTPTNQSYPLNNVLPTNHLYPPHNISPTHYLYPPENEQYIHHSYPSNNIPSTYHSYPSNINKPLAHRSFPSNNTLYSSNNNKLPTYHSYIPRHVQPTYQPHQYSPTYFPSETEQSYSSDSMHNPDGYQHIDHSSTNNSSCYMLNNSPTNIYHNQPHNLMNNNPIHHSYSSIINNDPSIINNSSNGEHISNITTYTSADEYRQKMISSMHCALYPPTTSPLTYASTTSPLTHASTTSPLTHASTTSPLTHASTTSPLTHASTTSPLTHASTTSPLKHVSSTFSNIPSQITTIDANAITISSDSLPDLSNHNNVEKLPFIFEYDTNCSFVADKECCICFESYYDGMVMKMLPCDHVFHHKCLNEWLSKQPRCPLCNITIVF